ncbi:MAG: iron-sulfur cluster repair di-iron protein, partial [Vicinamibacteria bacterium]
MYESFETVTVGEVVASDFRTAAVFQRFGIDFCCGGKRSIAVACKTAAADPALLLGALKGLSPIEASIDDQAGWPLDRLTEHIVSTHHKYIRTSSPVISGYLEKLVKVHGARHPELARVERVFAQMSRDLEPHMMKEEHVLFPYLNELARAGGEQRLSSPFGTVENPIRMMEREHEEVGNEMRLIRELTNNFTPPADGCTTYKVCFAELARFEEDLH